MQRIILDTDPGIDDALALFLALTSPEIQLEAITTVSGNVPVDLTLMAYFFDVFAAQRADPNFHMHDPLCLASVFQPDLISWQPAYVDVELTGTLTLGETVAYFRRLDKPESPNMRVSLGADGERFMQLFLERIKRL